MAGVGLAVLRVAGAIALFSTVRAMEASGAAGVVLGVLATLTAIALLVGLATTVAALLGCVLSAVALWRMPQTEVYAVHVCVFIALASLGPGASSLDARLHGRRVVHLQARRPDDE